MDDPMTVIVIIIIILAILVGLYLYGINEANRSNKNNSSGGRPSLPPRPAPRPPYSSPPQTKSLDQLLKELVDARDNARAVDANVDREMKKTVEVVRRVRTNAQTNMNLGIDDLMRKVNSLVDYAEKISGNANPAYFKKGSDNFVYNEHLWYRARLAGVAFKEASQLVQAKLNELHKINFSSISPSDRQKIMQLQSADGLVALKNALLNNAITMFSINKNIKELIRVHCGEGGRLWAEKMDKSGEGKR